jgi:hypothetical protein
MPIEVWAPPHYYHYYYYHHHHNHHPNLRLVPQYLNVIFRCEIELFLTELFDYK